MYPIHSNEYFMQQAIDLAKKAAELGEIPVAALLVKDNTIIAKAHNRRELDKNPIAHAEMLVIQEAAQKLGDWRLEGCTMFVTLEPCAMCAGAMWLSRVEHCVFGAHDHRSGFLGSVHNLCQHTELNHQYTFESGILGEACMMLLKDFFKVIREEKKKRKKQLTDPPT